METDMKGREKDRRTDLRKPRTNLERRTKVKSTVVCISFLVLQVTASQERRREEAISDIPCCLDFLRRRVNPRAASNGGAWRRLAATVFVAQKASSIVPELFL